MICGPVRLLRGGTSAERLIAFVMSSITDNLVGWNNLSRGIVVVLVPRGGISDLLVKSSLVNLWHRTIRHAKVA